MQFYSKIIFYCRTDNGFSILLPPLGSLFPAMLLLLFIPFHLKSPNDPITFEAIDIAKFKIRIYHFFRLIFDLKSCSRMVSESNILPKFISNKLYKQPCSGHCKLQTTKIGVNSYGFPDLSHPQRIGKVLKTNV